MKRHLAWTALLFTSALPSVADADLIPQNEELTFGVMGSYVPQQNNLQGGAATLGHYVSFSHSIDFFYVGFHLGLSYGWLPSTGGTGQYLFQPDAFIGFQHRVGEPINLRVELGTGPLVNGGSGFTTEIIDHTYVRGLVQWTFLKSVMLEAFVGPAFIIGPSAAAVYPELGIGCGWSF